MQAAAVISAIVAVGVAVLALVALRDIPARSEEVGGGGAGGEAVDATGSSDDRDEPEPVAA
jgi:hypothetical protein